jgi:DNA repair photolyase
MVAPIIPQLNDRDLEAILEAAAAAGARSAGCVLVRLPLEVAPLFRDWLGCALSRARATRDEPHAADARRP